MRFCGHKISWINVLSPACQGFGIIVHSPPFTGAGWSQ